MFIDNISFLLIVYKESTNTNIMRIIIALLFLFPFVGHSQLMTEKGGHGGRISLGMRSTFSTFNSHEDEGNGLGVGGQFRIQFADRVNSDWFFDFIKSDIGNFASRTDYHIGWSVLYYLTGTEKAAMATYSSSSISFPRLRPYILAGHCFDYTRLVSNFDRNHLVERWSSAVQAGFGTHINLTPRWDLSLVGQYMMHLGNEVGAHYENGVVEFHDETSTSIEGHLLFHVSVNYKIGDAW